LGLLPGSGDTSESERLFLKENQKDEDKLIKLISKYF